MQEYYAYKNQRGCKNLNLNICPMVIVGGYRQTGSLFKRILQISSDKSSYF